MKKLLDSNFFVGVWIALQVFFLAAGVLVAINDGGHTSVALLIMVIVFSVVAGLVLALLALFLKSTKKWVYLGILAFWLLPFFSFFVEFSEAYSYEEEYEDVMEQMQQDSMYEIDEEMKEEWSEEGDSILVDSISH